MHTTFARGGVGRAGEATILLTEGPKFGGTLGSQVLNAPHDLASSTPILSRFARDKLDFGYREVIGVGDKATKILICGTTMS